MRGIPFKASQGDVIKFFAPLMPRHIEIIIGDDGRPSGTAYAFFHSHEDAILAMEKDKENMGWFVCCDCLLSLVPVYIRKSPLLLTIKQTPFFQDLVYNPPRF